MIFPSSRLRFMVATKPADFRKGHDGLAALVKNELHKDPFTGTVFVFRSRKADRLKLIYWDGSGDRHGLQTAGRAHVHMSQHQAWIDNAHPRLIRSAVRRPRSAAGSCRPDESTGSHRIATAQ